MTTALARRNKWARQLKRLRDERNRRVEDEPEGKFRAATTRESIGNRPFLIDGGKILHKK